jgi:hypothetical protein
MWIAAIFGIVGTIVGIIVGQIFSAAREHRNWVNDQKRLEYKELLDQLFQSVTVMSKSRPGLAEPDWKPINDVAVRLSRIFAGRLFIADALEKAKANEDWLAMKKLIYYLPALHSETPAEFRYTSSNLWEREDNLRKKILELAKKDIVKFSFSLL